jgi:FtsP/CotA-like multicopper oxidase with cupredoxin domain
LGIKNIPPAQRFELVLEPMPFTIDGKTTTATAINGTLPGPLLRFKEGEEVTLHVTNGLDDKHPASIHWHGILLPSGMDGVPKVSFPGIPKGETFTYRYRLKQSGTYWYHSHTRFQQQTGMYGPLIVDPIEPDPYGYDREYVVMLSDWTFEDPDRIFSKLKMESHYYNYQRRTAFDFFKDASQTGFRKTLEERLAWARMRMDPTDIADITGATYAYLINGHSSQMNWTGLFNPGERVRLRFINGSAMTNFDLRIPGLDMTIVQADGMNVKPFSVHEFRIAVAETYDAIIEPKEDRAYTIFAESFDRSGVARATLSPRLGEEAPVPKRRPRPVRRLEDIGMAGMAMNSGHGMQGMPHQKNMPKGNSVNVAMRAMHVESRLHEPGLGLGENGWRVLAYTDLKSLKPNEDQRPPERELVINLTSNMERFMFSFNGKKFSEHDRPTPLFINERLRLVLVNHTMMEHPIHLHGQFMELENGSETNRPYKHTINVKPAEKLSLLLSPPPQALGKWAFHCHLLFHMEAGMFLVMQVTEKGEPKGGKA